MNLSHAIERAERICVLGREVRRLRDGLRTLSAGLFSKAALNFKLVTLELYPACHAGMPREAWEWV
jgi:hypothetical protein